MAEPPLVAVVGTTASGKSDLAIQLARRFDGEVVSADSRQVYRGLDIGTGKVTPAEQAGVPHHLLDVADVRQCFTVADYQALAEAALRQIWARGRLPLLVGGTGLYVRAVVDNLRFPRIAPDHALRRELERRPLPELVAELERLDPVTAGRIDRRNPRRVVRALEVTRSTGMPFSAQRGAGPPPGRVLQLGVTWPTETLRARIRTRLRARLEARPGLVDEVQALLAAGVPASRLLELGLEYRFVTRYVQGELGFEPMVAALETAIWRYAKRQRTWFGRDARVRWLDPERDLVPQAERLVSAFLASAATGTNTEAAAVEP
jgi:tRNA dimethylallyltransferase